ARGGGVGCGLGGGGGARALPPAGRAQPRPCSDRGDPDQPAPCRRGPRGLALPPPRRRGRTRRRRAARLATERPGPPRPNRAGRALNKSTLDALDTFSSSVSVTCRNLHTLLTGGWFCLDPAWGGCRRTFLEPGGWSE